MRPSRHRLIGFRGTVMATLLAALIGAPGSFPLHADQAPSAPEYRVEITEAWIGMSDGAPLAADLSFTNDRDNFYYRYTRRLEENGALVREKTWTGTIPRGFQ